MNKLQNTDLHTWEIATNDLALHFERKYFGRLDEDSYWVVDGIGGTYAIADYFFSLSDMVDYLRYRYTEEQMFEHYEYALDKGMKDELPICIRDWKKIKK